MRQARCGRRGVAPILAGLAALVLLAACSQTPSPPARQRHAGGRALPVVMVHGHSVLARGNAAEWDATKRTLRAAHFTGPLIAACYYAFDRHCDVDISRFGNHRLVDPGSFPLTHLPSPRGTLAHTPRASIRHLAYHLAWYLYDTYTAHGQAVNLDLHSMGGLVGRYMVEAVATRQAHFPRRLLLRNVVTLGTPYAGARELVRGCDLVREPECLEMTAGSSLLVTLARPTARPLAGRWVAVGSAFDVDVAAQSAVAVRAPLRVIYSFEDNLPHSGYFSRGGPATFAARVSANQGPWRLTTHEPSPLALAAETLSR